MNVIEIVGVIASISILISMCFNSSSYKGSLLMRIFNLIGSIILTVYGSLIQAFSVVFLNGILVLVNIYYLIDLIVKNYKKNKIDKE